MDDEKKLNKGSGGGADNGGEGADAAESKETPAKSRPAKLEKAAAGDEPSDSSPVKSKSAADQKATPEKTGSEEAPAEKAPPRDEAADQQDIPASRKEAASSVKKTPPTGESKVKPSPADKPDKAAAGGKTPPEPAAKAGAKPPVKKKVVRKPPIRKPRGPAYEDLEEDPLQEALAQKFGEGLVSAQSFLNQNIYTVSLDELYDILLFLRDDGEWNFDYLIDLTALDYLGDEERFCLVYQLYSYPNQMLIRVKARIAAGVVAPSATSIWKTADWMEREVFDMFGIEFSGHPDLKRILLPEDWHGHPLRKDYDIKLQDQSWIRKHLTIRKVPS